MKKQIMCVIVLTMLTLSFLQGEEVKKELTLKEAIYHALKHNLEMQIQVKDMEISRENLEVAKSIFDPLFSLTVKSTEGNTEGSSALDGVEEGETVTKTNKSFTSSITQLTPFGGSISLTLDGKKSTSNSDKEFGESSFKANGTLAFSQPLLKNFGMSSTKKGIRINANNVKISKETLKTKVIDLVYRVEAAYWDLVHGYEQLKVTKMALKRAQDTLRQNEVKVRVGSAAPIDLLQTKAEVARQESELISGEKGIQTNEEVLKKILNMSKERCVIIPLDKPGIHEVKTNFDAFLAEALENRPDIHTAQLGIRNGRINKKYYKNQLLPDVSLTGSYKTAGLSNGAPDEDGNFTERLSYGTALKEVLRQDYKNYDFAIEAKLPLLRTKVKADYRKANIELSKSELSLRNTENTVYSEVKQVIKELETNAKLVESQKVALKVQGEKLRAEEKRMTVGITTVFLVLEAQKNYAQVQASYLQTIIAYNMTVAKINKVLARTLKMYDIKFEEFTK
ncbi:MAG: TolC family protein [bacterium]|nr:TolC family protein [bacterium]